MRVHCLAFCLIISVSNNAVAESVIWRSSGSNGDVVSAEIEQLYIRLLASGTFPTVEYKDNIGKDVQTILRETDKFEGSNFPIGISSVLCKLNEQVCRRNSSNEPVWFNKAGDTIKIPAFKFTQFTTFETTSKKSGDTVGDLLTKGGATCSDLGVDCNTAVKKLNKTNPSALEKDAEGPVVLPKRAYEAVIEQQLPQAQNVEDNLLKEIGKTSGFALPSFDKRLVPNGALLRETSYGGEPLFGKQDPFFRLLRYDFAELTDISKVGTRFQKPIKVEVLDSWFDADHCDIPNVVVLARREIPALARDPMQCGTALTDGQWSPAVDHATHVIGLIGAAVNGKVGGGLEPFARILYRQVPLDEFANSKALSALANDIGKDFFANEPSIFNLSWGYRSAGGQNDPLKHLMKVLKVALFVVAAGNENSEFEGDCPAMPACLSDLPNVITVIGLNADDTNPAVWTSGGQGSNVSPQFNIGGIAENVISTSARNGYASASGTSQAAPQVTAAAAYIYSAYDTLYSADGELNPNVVKNRLIYTTDLFPQLFNVAMGGRLNFKRALDIASDNVEYSTPSGVKESFRGHLDIPDEGADDFLMCKQTPQRDSIRIRFAELKRLFFSEDLNNYVVFYTKPAFDGSKLNRVIGCDLKNPSQALHFTGGGADITVRADAIRDFTSSL